MSLFFRLLIQFEFIGHPCFLPRHLFILVPSVIWKVCLRGGFQNTLSFFLLRFSLFSGTIPPLPGSDWQTSVCSPNTHTLWNKLTLISYKLTMSSVFLISFPPTGLIDAAGFGGGGMLLENSAVLLFPLTPGWSLLSGVAYWHHVLCLSWGVT